jgi:hypothetical protein
MLFIICTVICAAGCSVRICSELSKEYFDPLALVWYAIEILALVYILKIGVGV